MGLFTTKSCCFCLSVRTGGIAFGVLVLLQGILSTLVAIHEHTQYSRYYRSMYRDSYSPNYAKAFIVQLGTNYTSIHNYFIKLTENTCICLILTMFVVQYAYSDRSTHYIRCNCLAIWHLQGKLQIFHFFNVLNTQFILGKFN